MYVALSPDPFLVFQYCILKCREVCEQVELVNAVTVNDSHINIIQNLLMSNLYGMKVRVQFLIMSLLVVSSDAVQAKESEW